MTPSGTHSAAARGALIDAGLKLLAEGRKAADLQMSQLTLAAGLPPAAFAECYPTQTEFLLDLFQHLLDAARDAATLTTANPEAGSLGVKRGIEAYLDTHLRHPALRELTLLLRDRAAAQDIIGRRIAGFHRVLQVGLSALRALYPLASAQLVTAMVIEISQAEYEVQNPLPDLRETLYAYIDRLVP